jgi:hypothetical protein
MGGDDNTNADLYNMGQMAKSMNIIQNFERIIELLRSNEEKTVSKCYVSNMQDYWHVS